MKRNATPTPETIADLTLDDRNARRRGPRAEGMLVASLQEVGAARSIVIDEHGRILAGNGTVQAAAEAGIERVKVVDADGETIVAVRRTGLTEQQKRRLALLDNRTAELAEWDAEVLATLAQDGTELGDLWSDNELEALLTVVLGDDIDGQARTTNNMQILGAGGKVGLQWGEIMCALPADLYRRVLEYLDDKYTDDRAAGMLALITDGLSR